MKVQEYLEALSKVAEKNPEIVAGGAVPAGQITFTGGGGGAEEEPRISPEAMSKIFKKGGFKFPAEDIKEMYSKNVGLLAGSLTAMTLDNKWIHFWI